MKLSKRSLDIFLALLLIVILALPFAALLAVLLAVEGRPLFHVSERMKTRRQAFRLWKLRTMRVSEADSGVSGGHKLARVTRTGRALRRYRLDEIPQLWNVLRGDMSFVGPRPPLREYVDRFPDVYQEVLSTRPGVTGMATLIYHAHEERLLAACKTPEETDAVYCRRCIPRKARLDRIYARHCGLVLDIALLVKTVVRVAPLRAKRSWDREIRQNLQL